YMRNFKIRTSVPSKLYSKEVKIDSDFIKGYPSILSTNDGYIISYTVGNKVILNKIDKLGKKIKRVSINGYSEYINDINLVCDKNSYYAVFTTYIDGSKKAVEYNFDNDLDKIGEKNISSINNIIKIDGSSLAYTYDSKVTYKNFAENYSADLNYKGIKLISGIKQDDGYYLILMESDGKTRVDKIESGKTEEKYSYLINKSSNMEFKNIAAATDDKNLYGLIEVDLKGEAKGVNILTIPKQGGNISYKAFNTKNSNLFYNLIPVSSGSEAKFIGITDVPVSGGKYSEELTEFSIKHGVCGNIINATRIDQLPYSPSYSADSMIFLTNEGDYKLSLYITSKSDKFKEANNGVRSGEKDLALSDTASGILTSFAYVFILGIAWILFGAVLMGFITFLDWKKNNAKTDIMLYISYIITALFKTYIVYKTIYIRFEGSVNGFFSNPVYGCLASLIISLICFTFLMYWQKKDEDTMPFFLFFLPLLIDTVLTQLLFVPYL
ncbi:MAG: hypothetical protein LIR50_16565, partial [Bacillota bacterium]|nr:hypothetical protein [Bacillota bacterium]